MTNELMMLRGKPYEINQWIHINNPTLDQIVEYGEKEYYALVSCLCATPSDFKVQLLDNFGIDYEEMDEFEFFYMVCRGITVKESRILFGDRLDLSSFAIEYRDDNTDFYMKNSRGVIIDRGIYLLITDYLRMVNGYEKHVDIAGNEHTKQYLIEKDRRKLRYVNLKPYKSMLSPLVSSMVSFSGFKYDYDTVWDLSIYRFMDAVTRTSKYLAYRHLMNGIYAGTVDSDKVSQDRFDWMGSRSE